MDTINYAYNEDGTIDLEKSSYNPNPDFLNEAMVEELLTHLNSMQLYLVNEIYYLGKSEKEIALENNMSVSTVKRYHTHLLEKLNNIIRKREPEENVVDIENPTLWHEDTGWVENGKTR